MATYPFNPYRSRASEQQRETRGFVRTFAAGILQLLPDALWDRLFIIRSAPGGGKTSLLRLMTYESLKLVDERSDENRLLVSSLRQIGALGENGPLHLGVLVSLGRDYRSLLDVGAPPEAAVSLFRKLLDARIMAGVVRTALAASGGEYPGQADRVQFRVRAHELGAEEALARVGGSNGGAVAAAARSTEAEITRLVESLRPVQWGSVASGHADLHSLKLLSHSDVTIDGTPLATPPLLLFDDGQNLAPLQRAALLEALISRDLGVSRWYAERLQALAPEELIGHTEGRDYTVLDLEAAARQKTASGGRGGRRRFERFLLDVGDLRAAQSLDQLAGTDTPFSDLLRITDDERIGGMATQVIGQLSGRVKAMTQDQHRYDSLIDQAEELRGYGAAVRWRQLEIVIERERAHPMAPMFDFPMEEEEIGIEAGATAREAAELLLAREFDLPYYAGPDVVARLASQNVDQFLSLCGDLFEQMLAEAVLNRRPRISAARQHAVLVAASERMWRDISRRIPHGHDVQRLLLGVVQFAQRETYRPTAPYAPGVTGTALRMRERAQLLDDKTRAAIPGADSLFRALGAAVAFNVVSAEPGVSVKGDSFMVLYLNRLLLPRMWLPLGRGGFRERTLTDLSRLTQIDARRPSDDLTTSMDLIP